MPYGRAWSLYLYIKAPRVIVSYGGKYYSPLFPHERLHRKGRGMELKKKKGLHTWRDGHSSNWTQNILRSAAPSAKSVQ